VKQLLARPLHPHPAHCKRKDGSISHIVPEELELQVPGRTRWKKQAPLVPKSRFVCQKKLCSKQGLAHVSGVFLLQRCGNPKIIKLATPDATKVTHQNTIELRGLTHLSK